LRYNQLMKKSEILEYLKANQDARGIEHWKTHAEKSGGLKTYGGGLTKRSKVLNAATLRVAMKIGPIDFDPDGSCDPMDVSKHLTSSYVVEELGL
jgi:hypothetical protein